MNNLPTSEKLSYRIYEAVKASGLGRSYLYQEIKAGNLPSFRAGGCRLIMCSDLLAFLERHKSRNGKAEA